MPIVAELESSLIQSTRELQSACEGVFESGSIEQVSYLFNPPSVLESLVNFDLEVLDQMDAELAASRLLPGTVPDPQVESETAAPQAGSSTSANPAPPSFIMEPIPVDDTDMEHPSFEVLRQSSPAPEIPAEDEEPEEEDELAMSGVEDAAEDTVGDEVKRADEF
jgi:hypothetical protein